MPTYDYRCDACGHVLEVFQSISEAPKRKCPQCGKAKLVRQIGAGAGILFKGGGFYQTDYRSDSYKKAEGAERGGAAEKQAEPKSANVSAPLADAQTSKPAPAADASTSKPAPADKPARSARKKRRH